MGCCLTTAAAADDSKSNSKRRDAPPLPPALPFEEETVKEVLSETSFTSKKPPSFNSTPTKITAHDQQIPHHEQDFKSKNAVVLTKNPIKEDASEVSSEMYTCSASFSAATTTTIGTGTIDEDGEVTQKVKKPSPAKMVSKRQPTTYSGERASRKERVITRTPLPAPARRSVVPSTVKKPDLPSRNITTSQRRQHAQRSRSPALRGEAGQNTKVKERSPVRKSGNRVPVNVAEKKGNVIKKINDRSNVPKPEPEPETGESLENPRVSLECFIFL